MLIKIHRSTIVLSGISNPKQQCSHEYIYFLYYCDCIFDVTLCVEITMFVILMTDYYWYGYYLGFLQCRSSHTIFYNCVPKGYVLKVHQQPTLGV